MNLNDDRIPESALPADWSAQSRALRDDAEAHLRAARSTRMRHARYAAEVVLALRVPALSDEDVAQITSEMIGVYDAILTGDAQW